MVSLEVLKRLVHSAGVSRTDQLLLVLLHSDKPTRIVDLKRVCAMAGLRAASKWNVSAALSRSGGAAIRVGEGWELSPHGRAELEKRFSLGSRQPAVVSAASDLRTHAAGIADPTTRSFVEEALTCFEAGANRAAVVLSWVGAVSLLYQHVLAHSLPAFNAEAVRRFPKWKPAATRDDLARMGEADFLGILEGISVVGKSVKQQLDACLQLRNGAGHPNTLTVGERVTAAHLEHLIHHVFKRF